MHKLISPKVKVGLIAGLTILVAAIADLVPLDLITTGILITVINLIVGWMLLNSWSFLHEHILPILRRRGINKFPYAWANTDLSGSWNGVIKSKWKAKPTDPALPDIPVTVKIYQTWREVVFTMRTEKMKSRSSNVLPMFDPVTNELRFRYQFETEPTAQANDDNPPQRNGSACAVINLNSPDVMEINYTNERSPGGDIRLQKIDAQKQGTPIRNC